MSQTAARWMLLGCILSVAAPRAEAAAYHAIPRAADDLRRTQDELGRATERMDDALAVSLGRRAFEESLCGGGEAVRRKESLLARREPEAQERFDFHFRKGWEARARAHRQGAAAPVCRP